MSVCVCTLAGASRIADTLWSLVCQSAEADRYEIIVIENDPSAQAATSQVIDEIRGPGRHIRLIVEPRPGLSNARNRGVMESQGQFVFFIDDDATASPRLVESYLDAISEHSPDVIGGNILPHFEELPPPELEYSWWPHWSLKHFGACDRWLGTGEYFLGTNMGASRELLVEHPFDVRLGRTGEDLAGGEEWFLGEDRYRRRFVPGATVYHQVTVERMQPAYFVRRMYAGSISRSRTTSSTLSPARISLSYRVRTHVERLFGQVRLLGSKLRWTLRVAIERRRYLRAKFHESQLEARLEGAGESNDSSKHASKDEASCASRTTNS